MMFTVIRLSFIIDRLQDEVDELNDKTKGGEYIE